MINFKKVIIVLSIGVILAGCSNNEDTTKAYISKEPEPKVEATITTDKNITTESNKNTIYPMILNSNERELAALLTGAMSNLILSTTLDDTIHSMRIYIETYSNGDLINESESLSFQVNNPLNFALIMNEFGYWNVNVRSGQVTYSTKLDIRDKSDLTEDLISFSTTLPFEVSVEKDLPLNIAAYYFDDSGAISSDTSVFYSNQIENIGDYKYIYLIKVVFE